MIIPAAGFGTRVGNPPAKEILFRAGTAEPLIDAPIRWGQERGWRVVVVTRKDKHVLVDYLQQNHPLVNLYLIDFSDDWESTVLQSQSTWTTKNLLVLPDTEFKPLAAIDQISLLLGEFEVVTARHTVEDPQLWGHIWRISDSTFGVAEKPTPQIQAPSSAWGVIGFRKTAGESLFKAQWLSQKNQQIHSVEGRLGIVELREFRDLTR